MSTEAEEEEEEEYSLHEIHQLIYSKFLLKCPPDFQKFYEFCCTLSPQRPLGAFYESTGLRLVGPFILLHNPKVSRTHSDFTDCYRYYHDPPELVTVLADYGTYPYHIGYFRDDYRDEPSFLVSNDSSESGQLSIIGGDIFSAVLDVLEQQKEKDTLIFMKLLNFAIQNGLTLRRKASVVRRHTGFSLNLIGFNIALPEDTKCRPMLYRSDEIFTALHKAMINKNPDTSYLDDIIASVQRELDEGNYGQCLELGLSLLAYHPFSFIPFQTFRLSNRLNGRILYLLTAGYQLAGRSKFAEVIAKHMEYRSSIDRM